MKNLSWMALVVLLVGCVGVEPQQEAVEAKMGATHLPWTCDPPGFPIYSDPLYSPCWSGLPQCMAPNLTGNYLDPLNDMKMNSEGRMSGPARIWVYVPGRGTILAVQDRTQPNTPLSRVQFYANNWSASPAASNQNWGVVNVLQGRLTGNCGQANNQFSMTCSRHDNHSLDIPVNYTIYPGFTQHYNKQGVATTRTLDDPPNFGGADYFQFQGPQGYWSNTVDMDCLTYAYIGPVGSGATSPANWQIFYFTVPAYRQVWYETGENGEQCFYPPGSALPDHTHLHSELGNIPYIPIGDPRDIMVFDSVYNMMCGT